MAEPLTDLAADLDAALAALPAAGDCGCKGKQAATGDPWSAADDLGGSGEVPPIDQMEQDLATAAEDALLGGGDSDFGPAEEYTLEDLLALLRQYPGLKVTLSY
jgi:hypothetical protein